MEYKIKNRLELIVRNYGYRKNFRLTINGKVNYIYGIGV